MNDNNDKKCQQITLKFIRAHCKYPHSNGQINSGDGK